MEVSHYSNLENWTCCANPPTHHFVRGCTIDRVCVKCWLAYSNVQCGSTSSKVSRKSSVLLFSPTIRIINSDYFLCPSAKCVDYVMHLCLPEIIPGISQANAFQQYAIGHIARAFRGRGTKIQRFLRSFFSEN